MALLKNKEIFQAYEAAKAERDRIDKESVEMAVYEQIRHTYWDDPNNRILRRPINSIINHILRVQKI